MANEKPSVRIIYNGLERSLEYNPEAAVRALLDHAIKAFGITQNPHLVALFNQAGVELQDNQSAETAGIKAGDLLLLRPSAVRGG
jgi:hypothetical protein